MKDGSCGWCGLNVPLLEHHTSYEPEVIVSICKKCHFMLHRNSCIPCQKCKGLGVIRYHKTWNSSCAQCDPDRVKRYLERNKYFLMALEAFDK